MKLLAKIVAIITMAVMAIALPAGGGADLTARQELDPPFCVPCPPGEYCNCDGSPPLIRDAPLDLTELDPPFCVPCPPGEYCNCDGSPKRAPMIGRQELDPPFCVPCPPGEYCNCDGSPPLSTRDTNDNLTQASDDPNLQCFPLSGTGVWVNYYDPKVFEFCSTLPGAALHLPATQGYLKTYTFPLAGNPDGNSVALSLTNKNCDEDAYFDFTICQDLFIHILGGCNRPGNSAAGNVNVGGAISRVVCMRFCSIVGRASREESLSFPQEMRSNYGINRGTASTVPC